MRSLRIICVLAGKHFRILSRTPSTLLVIFLPGIVLYTIFTQIFAGPAGRPFRVAVIDEDKSTQSAELIQTLQNERLKVITTDNEEPDGVPLTIDSARESIRRKGEFRVAVQIPKGFGTAPNMFSGPSHTGVILYYDETQDTEADIVTGMLQMAAGRSVFEKMFKLTPASKTEPQSQEPRMLVKVERRGVSIRRMAVASKHTFLAGIVPMFLLFLSTGSGRGLLDEMTSGTIRRQLAAPIHPAHIVAGQLLFSVTLGMLQCYIMYVYAWLVFGVTIWAMGFGLFLLTLATCLATTGFGMLIGAIARNGEQLDSLGTMANLAMSALGGSMVPRWIMPDFMKRLGLLTINGWSYDGFISLIRNEGFEGIRLILLVLLLMAATFSITGGVLLTRRLRAT
jgi:ABC-2 type transport system permease protein